MIFLANTLTVNGGTTFLVRLCKALRMRGEQCAVLLLRDHGDPQLTTDLAENAEIIRLSSFAGKPRLPQHFGIFGSVHWDALRETLRPFGHHVHSMGIFSLIFARRLFERYPSYRVTAGVYHQNEFMFDPAGLSFPVRAQRLFASLPPRNIVFFNEVVRDHYAEFFECDYSDALMVPIGIELPPAEPRERPPSERFIVSVGNLVDFKTYNRHVIEMLPELIRDTGPVRYDIYGSGPEEEALRALADQRGVNASVRFHGRLDYSRFKDVVSPATMFVGSGTALIEAAALGVPALIGIESNKEQTSYGFLSDVPGLTYNEDTSTIEKRPMLPFAKSILADPQLWLQESSACALKARDFSVDRTADGFASLERSAGAWDCAPQRLAMVRACAGLVGTVVYETITRQKSFSARRNQSFKGDTTQRTSH